MKVQTAVNFMNGGGKSFHSLWLHTQRGFSAAEQTQGSAALRSKRSEPLGVRQIPQWQPPSGAGSWNCPWQMAKALVAVELCLHLLCSVASPFCLQGPKGILMMHNEENSFLLTRWALERTRAVYSWEDPPSGETGGDQSLSDLGEGETSTTSLCSYPVSELMGRGGEGEVRVKGQSGMCARACTSTCAPWRGRDSQKDRYSERVRDTKGLYRFFFTQFIRYMMNNNYNNKIKQQQSTRKNNLKRLSKHRKQT